MNGTDVKSGRGPSNGGLLINAVWNTQVIRVALHISCPLLITQDICEASDRKLIAIPCFSSIVRRSQGKRQAAIRRQRGWNQRQRKSQGQDPRQNSASCFPFHKIFLPPVFRFGGHGPQCEMIYRDTITDQCEKEVSNLHRFCIIL